MNKRFINNDVYLVRRLRKGDKQAFELIFNKYKEKLYYFTLGYLHSSDETQEIIQKVFISLWENNDTLKEEHNLKNFLFKVTVNHIYNYFKHRAVHQKYVNHVSSQESMEDDYSQQTILFNDLKGTIDNIIETLPLKQQEIFKLSRQEGMSHEEIADRLGLTVRSVENHIYRALKHIRAKLNTEHLLTDN